MAIMNVDLRGEGKRSIFKRDSFLMNEKNLQETVFCLIRLVYTCSHPVNIDVFY